MFADSSNLGYSATYCYTVTYTSDGVESEHSDEACATTNDAPWVYGCTDETATNYNSEADYETSSKNKSDGLFHYESTMFSGRDFRFPEC